MKARVHVTLKNGVLDPQGKAIGHSLNRLGFPEVGDVRQGKYIELEIAETDKARERELKTIVRELPDGVELWAGDVAPSVTRRSSGRAA